MDTLLAQHQAGRRSTAQIEQLAVATMLQDEGKRRQLGDSLRAFLRMELEKKLGVFDLAQFTPK